MKFVRLIAFSVLSVLAAQASVVSSWTTSDVDAARAWIASLESNDADAGRGGQIYSTIEEMPVATHSLVGQLRVSGETATLLLFAVDRAPLNFDLIFLNPFSDPRFLISGVSSDFAREDPDLSGGLNSSRFSYSKTFGLQPGEWRLLSVANTIMLHSSAGEELEESMPFYLKAVPEPGSVILALLGAFCLLKRSRTHGKIRASEPRLVRQ